MHFGNPEEGLHSDDGLPNMQNFVDSTRQVKYTSGNKNNYYNGRF